MSLLSGIRVLQMACTLATVTAAYAGEGDENKWLVGEPVLLAGPEGAFDSVAVKDPSIVFYKGRWHVFYTARGESEYKTGYVAAKELTGLQTASRHELKQIRGKTGYGCAPQVLYFEPQQRWYLIYQTRDSNYQPMFSATTTISDPESWTSPTPLLRKEDSAKWIDFWVICDQTKACLFYTRSHKSVMVRSTSIEKFPEGWGEANEVLTAVHEAVHVYKVKGKNEYHLFYELNARGVRSFGMATADKLEGPFHKVTDHYAGGNQLTHAGKGSPWTEMVSHGELIRAGCNERMEYEPAGCRWLIQGMLKKEGDRRYESLPWRLGVMQLASPGAQRRSTDKETPRG